jgi:3-oxoacyl-[acyl-carrier protein] reductase
MPQEPLEEFLFIYIDIMIAHWISLDYAIMITYIMSQFDDNQEKNETAAEEEWDQTINSNLKGAFLFTKAVLPYMISKKSGVILNVNSGAGKAGFSNLSAYCASKFGLLGLAESLALEVSEHQNIRVLTIFLGEVATKMWQEYDFRYYRKKSKMLQPKDVAEKIAEMIFDTKTYKNGDSFEMYSNDI